MVSTAPPVDLFPQLEGAAAAEVGEQPALERRRVVDLEQRAGPPDRPLDLGDAHPLEVVAVLDEAGRLADALHVAVVGHDLPPRPDQQLRVLLLDLAVLVPVDADHVLGDRGEVEVRLLGVRHELPLGRAFGARVEGVHVEVAVVPTRIGVGHVPGVDGPADAAPARPGRGGTGRGRSTPRPSARRRPGPARRTRCPARSDRAGSSATPVRPRRRSRGGGCPTSRGSRRRRGSRAGPRGPGRTRSGSEGCRGAPGGGAGGGTRPRVAPRRAAPRTAGAGRSWSRRGRRCR